MRIARIVSVALLVCTAVMVSASPLSLEEYRGSWLLVVLTDDVEDPRPFEFNLAIAVGWDPLAARGVAVLDVFPPRWDVRSVAAQFAVAGPGFAAILVSPESDTVFVTQRKPTVDELVQQIDGWSPGS